MDDEPALLAAIAAHPEEDTPRLAYADWLDEHAGGLPEPASARIRAEFIRVQCEIKKLEGLTRAELNRYVELYRRQDAILTYHRRDLLGPLGDEITDTEIHGDVVFDRGFLATLLLDAERFLKHADGIAALKPLPDVRLSDVGPWIAADCPHPELPTALSIPPMDYPDWGGFLYEQGPFPRLRDLSLAGRGIGDGGIAGLIQSGDFPALTNLNLSGNEISDEGVRLLVGSPLWPRLRRLDLGANPISDEGAELLVGAAGTSRLEHLNLRYTDITHDARPRLLHSYGGRIDLF
jgi:uncharacterized protein (TIGR02996 family)